ncbi:ribonuclease HII [Patescibacteria group bacterium]|nr:MAG: ribonuclease HII [Patescibacteria group bacterium]
MIGIDEVGRGAWAGPLLVVAARDTGQLPDGLMDSKMLTKLRRQSLHALIEVVCDIGEGWVSAEEIDTLGLTEAMRLAVRRALLDVEARADEEIIMDGHINYCDDTFVNVQAVIDADATYPIVSAASIYAKVIRDAVMTDFAKQFPEYGLERHVGYGTAQHRAALLTHGITPIHRKSYKPVRAYVSNQNESSGRP